MQLDIIWTVEVANLVQQTAQPKTLVQRQLMLVNVQLDIIWMVEVANLVQQTAQHLQ